MAINSVNTSNNLFKSDTITSSAPANKALENLYGVSPSTSSTTTNAITNSSGNSLSSAVQQALVQLNAGKDISAFFNDDNGNQSSSNFSNNLLANLPGISGDTNGYTAKNQATSTPIKLDPNSSSIQLQSAIQKLITQLDNGNSSSEAAGLGSLQTAFNSLVSKSGGDPSAQNLQSFLKLVAVNIQGSTSIGSIFSTSA